MNQNGGSVVIGIADFILIASIFSLSIFGKQIADCDDKKKNKTKTTEDKTEDKTEELYDNPDNLRR